MKSNRQKNRAQPLSVPNVRQVLMVRPYYDGVLSPLQPVPPHGKGGMDGYELPVPQVVVLFRRGETAGQESHGVDLLVLLRLLRKDGPDAHIRGVHLHDELARGQRKDEHRAEVNRLSWAENALSASGVQEKGRRVEVRAVSGAATRLKPRMNRL